MTNGGGTRENIINVTCEVKYENGTYEVGFFNKDDSSADKTKISIGTDVHSDSPRVGEWKYLEGYDAGYQVQTSHRQADDPDWVVADSDWKFQVWSKRPNDIYLSSYINNDKCTWTTQFWYDEELLGTGVWNFCENADLAFAEKHAAEPESDNTVMIGAASAVAGFAVTMFALTRWGKAARAARNDN